MLKILHKRERVDVNQNRRFFEWRDMPTAGFSFDSDEKGKVDREKLNPAAAENYDLCLARVQTGEMHDRGVEEHHHYYTNPAVAECYCGKELVLDNWLENECECGRNFNMSGQELAPRSQWGYETGETYNDLVGPARGNPRYDDADLLDD